MSSSLIDLLIIMQCPSLSLVILSSFFFVLQFYFIFKLYIIVLVLPNIKMNPPQVYMCSPSWTLLPPPSPILSSILSDMRIVTPAFFCFPFAWNIFFHPLSLYMSLGLKWVSCRQHIYGSCFCIHSASLCLLVRAFNPFTFKVIIDIFVSTTIFLIVWDWSCRSFFFSLFLDYISPFNICGKAALVVLNSLNVCLSEKLLISPSILNEILARYSNLGCIFPFQYFKYILPFPSGLQSFCWKISC